MITTLAVHNTNWKI